MDATPKEPSVPPTSDILSSLPRCGISNLSDTVPCRALRCHQRHRIPSSPISSNHRTRNTSLSLQFLPTTCLVDTLAVVARRSLISSHFLRVLEEVKPCLRGRSSVTPGRRLKTILSGDRLTLSYRNTSTEILQEEQEFFMHIFISRRSAFDVYFTTILADHRRRTGRSRRLIGLVLRVGHIDKFRPKAPKKKVKPKRCRQCRAAPHGLCKVSII